MAKLQELGLIKQVNPRVPVRPDWGAALMLKEGRQLLAGHKDVWTALNEAEKYAPQQTQMCVCVCARAQMLGDKGVWGERNTKRKEIKERCLVLCLSYFSCCCEKYSDRSNLREKFPLSHSSRVQFIREEESDKRSSWLHCIHSQEVARMHASAIFLFSSGPKPRECSPSSFGRDFQPHLTQWR